MRSVRCVSFSWTFYFLSYFVCLISWGLGVANSEFCPHPSVPYAATYTNVTGGPSRSSWTVKYVCDRGYTLFGEETRLCKDSEWKGSLPMCLVNVALHKPASASSVTNGGKPGNAVDGKTNTVHEGKKCTETKSEKSPFWTVDLLESAKVQYVRLTTRCCDDLLIKNAEIRVGNSTTPADNPLCNWIPKALEQGITETFECVDPIVGQYVSVVRSGVEAVLSLCEVEVFSSSGLSIASCTEAANPDQLAVFDNSCFHFLNEEIAGYDEATSRCEEEDYSLLDHLTPGSTKFVTSKVDQDRTGSKSLMIWLGTQRQRTSNFRGEEWRWQSSKQKVASLDWAKGQPNNYNQEQNCAVLDSDLNWGWNDLSCRISAFTVCRGKPSRCPSPPTAEGTTVTLADSNKLTYHCVVGQMPIGQVNQTCGQDGKWDGQPISCKEVECGQVPGLANGEIHVLNGRTNWGARVKYKCKNDYSLMGGEPERTCLEQGWSGTAPECVYTKCSELKIVENADVTIVGDRPNYLGSKVSYSCKEGYKPSGSLSRECLEGGKWSGTSPKCEFLDCGDPPKVNHANSVLNSGRTTFGAVVEYKCDSDYLPVGDTLKKCEVTGSWSRNILTCDIIECPQPRAPSGGRVSGYNREIHSKIEYSCLPGHVLEGEAMVTCTSSGLWSNRAPSCRYVDCGQVPNLDDGTEPYYVNGSTHLDSIVRYACDRSHSLLGSEERNCLANGRWSGTPPSCSEIRCHLPSRPNNTIVSVSSTERLHGTSVIRSKLSEDLNYRVGSTLKYRCERGYILKSESGQDLRVMTRRCTTTGDWTGDTPTCIYVDCGMPETLENTVYTLQTNNGTYYGSVVNYKCHDHFKLDGFERRRCETSGKWEPEAPSCKETLCKDIVAPSNGTMVLTTLRIGGRATFKCIDGFSLKGDDDIECLSSGSWSSWPPSCIEVDCRQPHEIENGRVFLSNGTTNIGSIVEYHCFPGYERDGNFSRACLEDGYWSGPEPECNRPRPPVTILSDNTVDGTHNVHAGGREAEGSSAGLYIGIALGLIVVVGLGTLSIIYYKKQRALASKPPAPYRDRNANNGVAMVGGYAATGVYHTVTGPNGAPPNGALPPGQPPRTAGINVARPPPPIQMYSMADEATGGLASNGLHHHGHGPETSHLHQNGVGGPPLPGNGAVPIYDTINDDHSSGASRYSGSDRYNPNAGVSGNAPPPTSTFKNGGPPYLPGYQPNHDYDTPEGAASESRNPATVTINGIAV